MAGGIPVVDEGASNKVVVTPHLERERVCRFLAERVEVIAAADSQSAIAHHIVLDRQGLLFNYRLPFTAVVPVEVVFQLSGFIRSEQLLDKQFSVDRVWPFWLIVLDENRIGTPALRHGVAEP